MGQRQHQAVPKAFEAQKRLQNNTPPSRRRAHRTSPISAFLSRMSRIFASEWQTQIGHRECSTLSAHARTRLVDGRANILVSSDRVANFAFLSLFEHRAKLLPVDEQCPLQYRSRTLFLQRYYGMSFKRVRNARWDGRAMVGGRRIGNSQWDEEGRQPPLSRRFDRNLNPAKPWPRPRSGETLMENDAGRLVCLSSFYAMGHFTVSKGLGQSHRNSDVENYTRGARTHYGTGGWVNFKLGSKGSLKLPPMPRVIDYARSLQIQPPGLVSYPRRQAF